MLLLLSTIFDCCVEASCHGAQVWGPMKLLVFLGQGLCAPARDAKNEVFDSESVLLFVAMSSGLVAVAIRYEFTPPQVGRICTSVMHVLVVTRGRDVPTSVHARSMLVACAVKRIHGVSTPFGITWQHECVVCGHR